MRPLIFGIKALAVQYRRLLWVPQCTMSSNVLYRCSGHTKKPKTSLKAGAETMSLSRSPGRSTSLISAVQLHLLFRTKDYRNSFAFLSRT